MLVRKGSAERAGPRLLLFNLVTDADDPVLGFTTAWIGALARRCGTIHVVTMRAGRVDVPDNVTVYSLGKERGYTEVRRAVEFYRTLHVICRGERIDGCLSHMSPLFTVLAAPLLKPRGIPVLTWYAHPRATWALKLAHHLSDCMVTSVATAYPYRQERVVVVGQGIDTDRFSPATQRPGRAVPVILCVSRLSPVKDQLTLVRAGQRLREGGAGQFPIVFVGGPASPRDAAYVTTLRERVESLHLADSVRFEGAVSGERLVEWYRQCTVHVNLTPTGFGDKVAWEAMACGKPCLVANEGFRETLGQYDELLRFPHGDDRALAERLRWVLSLTEEDRERIGQHLRRRVVELHNLDTLAARLVALLSSLRQGRIGGQPNAPAAVAGGGDRTEEPR